MFDEDYLKLVKRLKITDVLRAGVKRSDYHFQKFAESQNKDWDDVTIDEFLECSMGYALPGSTVPDDLWEIQQNGPMTIVTEGTNEPIPPYDRSDL